MTDSMENNMTKGKIVFTGHFMEYFIMSLGLLVLSVITFGLALPYYFYWNFKYFFSKMELEIYSESQR